MTMFASGGGISNTTVYGEFQNRTVFDMSIHGVLGWCSVNSMKKEDNQQNDYDYSEEIEEVIGQRRVCFRFHIIR